MAAAGTHQVTATPPGGATTDVTCWLTEVSILWGRDDPSSQPDASSATFTLVIDATTGPLPAAVEVGSTLRVTTTTAFTYTRFVGVITDIALGWDDAGTATPDSGVGVVMAAGVLADLGRRVVGDVPFPQELDGARVTRVMAAAGITLDPAFSDPGTVQIIARDIDNQPALDVAQACAQSAGGVVWTTRGGLVRYADADHRKATPSTLSLDVCDVLVTPTWRRTTEGLTNEVSIGYGLPVSGGDQARYTATSPTSITRYGRYGLSAATELATLTDATALGQLLLVRNSSPVWVMAELPVAVAGLTTAQFNSLLSLEMHALITLTGMPAIGTAPTSASLFVEGLAERLTFGVHEVTLVVSGYCRTVPAPHWDDVDPGWTWGGTTWVEQRRNLVTNPTFEGGTFAPYTASAGASAALSTARAYRGTTSALVTWPTIGALGCAFGNVAVTGLTIGVQYTLSAWLYVPAGSTAASPGVRVSGLVSGNGVTVADTWTRSVATFTATATSHTMHPAAPLAAATAGQTCYVDAVMFEVGPAKTYFDGDTTDTATEDYAWTGTAQASASTYSYAATDPAGVPPTLTWDDATCLGPPANLGQWNDQPATLRWNQVPAATTWDTYT